MDQPNDLQKLRIDRSAAGRGTRRRLGLWIIVAAAIAGAAAFAWTRMAGPVPVETAAVVLAWPSQGFTVLNATGYVVPQRKAALSSKATGRLEWLGVLEGSPVKAGQIVARLESRDVAASLDQAGAQVRVAQANLQQGEAELRDAEANFRRSQELRAKNFISAAQHDADRARVEKSRAAIASQRAAVNAAEASRRSAEVALEQTRIRAPFDGVVLTRNANVGDTITPFSAAADTRGAVVTIADMKTLEVEADVAEGSIGRIKVGQPCDIQLDALPGVRLAGTVSRMVPTVDRSKATVLVKVRFNAPDPRVLPEMSAKVAFLEREVAEKERQPVLALPPAALVGPEGSRQVFVVDQGRAKAVAVRTGAAVGDLVEVSGVNAGDRVILRPAEKVRDGGPVAAAKK